MKALLIALWCAFALVESVKHYVVIELYGRRPDYLSSFIVRAIAALIHGILVVDYVRTNITWYSPVSEVVWLLLCMLLFYSSVFALVFNLSLNKLRNKPLLYLGRNSGVIESFVANRPGLIKWYWLLLVVGSVSGSLLL